MNKDDIVFTDLNMNSPLNYCPNIFVTSEIFQLINMNKKKGGEY